MSGCLPANRRVTTRAQIVGLSQAGVEPLAIAKYFGLSLSTVQRWASCTIATGFEDKTRTGRPPIFNETLQLKLIGFYCQTSPLLGCGRWTIRWAEKHLDAHRKVLGTPITRSSIGRILNKHHLKPHRVKYFLHITDPDFFPKMEHLLELYENPPEHLFFFDECPGIQILQRIAPSMTTDEKMRWLKEFEYNRNGTLDIFAFLEHKTGKVFARRTFDHKGETFRPLFEQHVKQQPENAHLNYVMDNLSSHCNQDFVELVAKLCEVDCPILETANERRAWLQSDYKRIIIHFTPFHGSWLNLVENWFGILGSKCLHESFASAEAMTEAIEAFIAIWNDLLAHPFAWKYDGSGLHEKAIRRFIAILDKEREPLPVKFLTKQLLLINNLANSYWDKAEIDVWVRLGQLMQSKGPYLRTIIENDEKPRRRQKAKEALDSLTQNLTGLLEPHTRKAS